MREWGNGRSRAVRTEYWCVSPSGVVVFAFRDSHKSVEPHRCERVQPSLSLTRWHPSLRRQQRLPKTRRRMQRLKRLRTTTRRHTRSSSGVRSDTRARTHRTARASRNGRAPVFGPIVRGAGCFRCPPVQWWCSTRIQRPGVQIPDVRE